MRTRTVTSACALTLALSLSACGGAWLGESDDPSASPSQPSPPESPGSPSDSASESPTESASPTIPPAETGAFDREAAVEFPEEKVKVVRTTSEFAYTLSDDAVIAHQGGDPEPLHELPSEEGSTWMDLELDEESGTGVALQLTLDPGVGTKRGDASASAVRFDLETGEETGAASLKAPNPADGLVNLDLRAVSGDVAVVETWIDGVGDRVVAGVDLSSGERLWRRANLGFVTADDSVAVFSTGNAFVPGDLIALDLETGKRAWRGYRGALDVRPVGVDGRILTLAGGDTTHPVPVLTRIKLDNGRIWGKQRKASHGGWSCPTTREEVTVCQVDDGKGLAGVDVARGKLLWSLPKGNRVAPTVSLVHDGLAYGYLLDGRSLILDAVTGEDVPGDAGMAPVAVTDDGGYLVFIGKVTFMPWLER